jgi:hypothetical protein
MGYPKFIVFRVRLFLLAAVLGLAGANQFERSGQPSVTQASEKVAPNAEGTSADSVVTTSPADQ